MPKCILQDIDGRNALFHPVTHGIILLDNSAATLREYLQGSRYVMRVPEELSAVIFGEGPRRKSTSYGCQNEWLTHWCGNFLTMLLMRRQYWTARSPSSIGILLAESWVVSSELQKSRFRLPRECEKASDNIAHDGRPRKQIRIWHWTWCRVENLPLNTRAACSSGREYSRTPSVHINQMKNSRDLSIKAIPFRVPFRDDCHGWVLEGFPCSLIMLNVTAPFVWYL